VQQVPVSSSTTTIHEESGNKIDVDTLEYRPWIGFEAGVWWGSFTDDQRSFDDHCLIYDSDSLNETIEIVGFVQVSLQVMKPIQKVYLSFI
jgi:predicted acyl esterase